VRASTWWTFKLPHPLRDRRLHGPRLSRQAHKEDQEVPPPSMRPTPILGPRRPRVHPHWPRRHHSPRHGGRHRGRPRQGPPL
jgi:hypothetical protein